jgi:L-cysteine desulfidase
MEQKPKKAVLAVISAAVTTYIRTQEEAMSAAMTAAAATVPAAAAVSLYGSYGRLQMMEMRRLLSLRLARR